VSQLGEACANSIRASEPMVTPALNVLKYKTARRQHRFNARLRDLLVTCVVCCTFEASLRYAGRERAVLNRYV
jgi:hypothetical protein